MKKIFVLGATLITLSLCACSTTESKTEPQKQNADIDYSTYTGRWSEGGISHDDIIQNGGMEFVIEITNENKLEGYIFAQQGMSERMAEIDDISGEIENGECYCDFTDDGWGGTGTLYIKFLEDEIDIEVQNYEMEDFNSSGYGISGSYKVLRAEETTETDLSQTDLSEDDFTETFYKEYYSNWDNDKMLEEAEKRKKYLEKCSFYSEVLQYVENVREVRDIAVVAEPLYYTDKKIYTEEEFKDVPALILHISKNEIYARHGYIFKNEDLNNYFNGQLWYTPSCKAVDFDDSVFNEYEKENLELLSRLDHYNQ